jgi:hypothetical protein
MGCEYAFKPTLILTNKEEDMKCLFIFRRMVVFVLFLIAIGVFANSAEAADPLPSWNEGTAKRSIIDFVNRVTQSGSQDFVVPGQRIATFDNDGTLWSEQPMYFQLFFVMDRVKTLAPKHPEWKTKQPFKAVLENDMKTLTASGEKGLLQLVMATHAGMTTTEFEQTVKDWIATAKHPRFKRPYTDLVFQPNTRTWFFSRCWRF